ncbi:hypothetical protein [Rossellomorea sp. FS2]|uniref:hypothetical protein n=1 Tax=Rossellomorea sp. FS2 TaxID=3391447 RepID=UPI00064F5972|nr:hypothetical protein VL03_21255 [Rossellomorea marisflavi]
MFLDWLPFLGEIQWVGGGFVTIALVPYQKGFIQLQKGKYEENEFFYSAFVDLLVKIERMATTQRREIS